MGTGQMLLTIGAIILLGSIILTTNRGISNSGQVLMQTSFGIDAVSLAETVIQEAASLPFDQADVNDSTMITLSDLTPANSLGYENNDPTDLDDFDDYNGRPGVSNGFRLDSTSMPTGKYYIKTQVHYVQLGNLDPSTWPTITTYYKRLDVWVWNSVDSADKVHMATIRGYWGF
jgi:hypothetical protein